jgi:homogentisate phytyltransferase / homogentisate geranylgeranyltransferase
MKADNLLLLAVLLASYQLGSGFQPRICRPSVFHLSPISSNCDITSYPCTGKSYMTSSDIVDTELVNDSNEVKTKHSGGLVNAVKVVWDFSRPHTVVGSTLSILSLYLYATPSQLWNSPVFLKSLMFCIIPSVLMNIYITGLNQVTDVDIDKINKPYLPIASGALSSQSAINIILTCLAISSAFAYYTTWPLRWTLLGSAILGTVYSLPPFRLKRFPLLAAFCILVVRGSLVNLGFYLQAKTDVMRAALPSISSAWKQFPESFFVTAFFAIFGVVIAVLKDTPDIKGDQKFKIPTFSVRIGAKRMLR